MENNNFKIVISLFLFLGIFSLRAQQVSGIVYNKATQEPMEGVTVYFNNTTRGTITNSKGLFKIDLNEDIRTSLVVSFLGYKKIVQNNYIEDKVYKFYLEEEVSVLNEVFLSSKDKKSRKKDRSEDDKEAWSQKRKLNEFKKHFLGESKQAKSCEILNEDDIILEYDITIKKLSASSKTPIRILNKYLDYEITYDLQEFDIDYVKDTLVNSIRNTTSIVYKPGTVYYKGTSFYKDLNENSIEKNKKRRNLAYQGSVLHFMRAIYSDSLHEQGFKFFYKNEEVAPRYSLNVNDTEDSNSKEVCLFRPILVSDIFGSFSKIIPNEDIECFYVDSFGNHSPVKAITFFGSMGNQRIGDALPLDYQPTLEN
ncbi:MAG: carboxypeptidase-like regulatory domain-containing protein [Winogradskyella sp.]|jgi:hypothetical protein|uniref:carboxypeptidase-like regulatory domain-containing protein n=1 Tax=Xanthomarina gelatinilytica TaxID=1137281 RepID=UPI001D548C77|nr:carboxypeptidase-like regulatory domain-containing protein [Winogradskyella sp.]